MTHSANKILLVSTVAMTIRGFYLRFPAHFRQLGYRVDAMARDISSCEQCVQAFDNVWEIAWTRNPLDILAIIRSARQVRTIVAREQFDLVHVCTPIAAFVTRFSLRHLRKEGKVKIVYTAHGFHFFKGGNFISNKVYFILEKLAGRWTDRLMVVNAEDEAAARQQQIVKPDHVIHVPGCGIDTERFSADTISESQLQQERLKLTGKSSTRFFLMIANLIPRKQPGTILRAFAKLHRSDVHLLIAGDGPLRDTLQQLGAKLQLNGQVQFLGQRNDIPILIRASVATVLASRQEGLSQCVQESLALETPVIATNIRGVRDLLVDGNGILVAPGDIDGFVNAMSWVLEHPDEARAMGKKGPQRIESCTIERVLQIHEEVYTDILAEEEGWLH